MNEQIKFSIIVPIYNIENYLEKCMISLINQTYQHMEIILINDGSTDSCDEICMKYEALDERIIYIKKENGGVSSARNVGIQKMTGDYVWFVDGDDYIELNAVERLVNKLKNKDLDILVFNYFSVKNDVIKKIEMKYQNEGIEKDKLYMIQLPMPWAKVYQVNLFKNNGILFKEGIIYEDLALIPTLVNDTVKIDFCDDALYYYVQREGSTMHKNIFKEKVDDKFTALEALRLEFENNHYFEKYKSEIEYLHIKHLLIIYSMEIMKYGKNIYGPRLNKALCLMNEKFPKWINNVYLRKEPLKTRLYLLLLKYKIYFLANIMNSVARKILE